MIRKFIPVALLITLGFASNCSHIVLHHYTNGALFGVVSAGFEGVAAEFAYSCNGNHSYSNDWSNDYSADSYTIKDNGQLNLRQGSCEVLSLYCGLKKFNDESEPVYLYWSNEIYLKKRMIESQKHQDFLLENQKYRDFLSDTTDNIPLNIKSIWVFYRQILLSFRYPQYYDSIW